MNYKVDETLLMAYLYGELQGEEKEKVEQYLAEHPEAVKEMEALAFVRQALGQVSDKEVIAPPIVMEGNGSRFFWNTNYGKTIIGIAASITLIILVGKWTGLHIDYSDQALTIGFGEQKIVPVNSELSVPQSLSATEVQEMINASLVRNNETVQASLEENQRTMSESIRKTLASQTDTKLANLVHKTSLASEEQIRQFALNLQADNARMIKDYLTLNSGDQRKYIETLLVDFSKYMEQQQKNDLQILQAKVSTLEQNTDLFKYQTEQILTSIFASVDNSKSFATKN